MSILEDLYNAKLKVFNPVFYINKEPLIKTDLNDFKKDFLDTGRKYKNKQEIIEDIYQPLSGIVNIVRGALVCIIMVGLFIFSFPIRHFINGLGYWPPDSYRSEEYSIKKSLKQHIIDSLESFVMIIRGVSQLATFPLTWIFKIPIRLCLSTSYPFDQASPETGQPTQNNRRRESSYLDILEEVSSSSPLQKRDSLTTKNKERICSAKNQKDQNEQQIQDPTMMQTGPREDLEERAFLMKQ